MSDILSQTFQTNAAIIDASKRPPAPWVQTYIAAQLGECLMMHTGGTGYTLCMMQAIDPDRVHGIAMTASAKHGLQNVWDDPKGAREDMGVLKTYFKNARSRLDFCYPKDAQHSIAGSIAETGLAFIDAMQDAPDIKPGKRSQYLSNGYRANPFVALDTAAALTYHASRLMERAGIPPIEPFSCAEDYVTRIHANGYRTMLPHDADHREKLADSLADLRGLHASFSALTANPQAARIFKDFAHIGTLVGVTKFFTGNYAVPMATTTPVTAPSKAPENTAAVLAFRPRS